MPKEPMATLEATSADGLMPGHDIFCTPDNNSFYETKLYSELDSTQQEIRLIKLWPDTGSDLIECTLLEEGPLLNKKGQYTALSYCAGDASKTSTILLNGTRFNVFANLGHALSEIRHFWKETYGDRECILWIDQICINQSDIKERSHQVRFMREIYEYAEQVLACLSTKKIDPNGMDWLLGLVDHVAPRENDLDFTDYQKQKGELSFERFHWWRLKEHFRSSFLNEKFIDGWLAFYDFVGAPWWTRSWIFQEFIVASRVHFIYSGRYASWETLSQVLDLICSNHHMIQDRIYHLMGNLQEDGPEDRNLCRVLERVEHGKYRETIETIKFMVNNKAVWRGRVDLKELLAHSRYCRTSDPRDKVFAFIGLADPAYGILPDYSHPIAQVLTDTTIRIIQAENRLDVLGHAAASRPRHDSIVPSWVVDWTCEELSRGGNKLYHGTKLSYKDTGLPTSTIPASFHLLETSGGHLLALQVRAIFIDTLMIKDDFISNDSLMLFPLVSRPVNVFSSSAVRRDDELWIIHGCGIPLILRTQQNHGYELVSVAIVIRSTVDGWSLEDQLAELTSLSKRHFRGWETISIF